MAPAAGFWTAPSSFRTLATLSLFCINPIYCFGPTRAVWHVCCTQNCRPIHSSQTANPNCLQSGSESPLQQRTHPPPTKEIAGGSKLRSSAAHTVWPPGCNSLHSLLLQLSGTTELGPYTRTHANPLQGARRQLLISARKTALAYEAEKPQAYWDRVNALQAFKQARLALKERDKQADQF